MNRGSIFPSRGPIFTSVALCFGLVAYSPFAGAADQDAALGQSLYTNCAPCHGTSGEGGFGPPFAANEDLKNGKYIITHVLDGSRHMPAFKDQLSVTELAAVVNYLRNSWGNKDGMISSNEIGIESGDRDRDHGH